MARWGSNKNSDAAAIAVAPTIIAEEVRREIMEAGLARGTRLAAFAELCIIEAHPRSMLAAY
jgi:hypothetical protein